MYFANAYFFEAASIFMENFGDIEAIDEFEKSRNKMIKQVLISMNNTGTEWDENCEINIKWIGDTFITKLRQSKELLNKESIDLICSFCFRFLVEMDISTKNRLIDELEYGKRFVINNLDEFGDDAKTQLKFAMYEMPIAILKALAGSDAVANIKDFRSIYEKIVKSEIQWSQDLKERENKVDNLRKSLLEFENGFNFVGLFQGFEEFGKAKEKEVQNTLFWLRIISVIVVLPIICEIAFVYFKHDTLPTTISGLLSFVLPTLSLVGISIFYFRVLLRSYNNSKSHLLQIELRKTLCRFIQSYASYAEGIKKNSPDSLSKFENVIFSGIISDEEKLPSTYDGLEQVVNLIKSAKA